MKEVWQSYSEEEFQRRKESANQQPAETFTTKTTATKTTSLTSATSGIISFKRKKPSVWLALGATAFVVSIHSLGYFFLLPRLADMQLKAVATGLNKACPKNLNDDVRWDNVAVLANKTMQYNYTMLRLDKERLTDTVNTKNLMKPVIADVVRNSPEMEFFRRNKVTLAYCYTDRFGQYLYQLILTPEDYAKEGSL